MWSEPTKTDLANKLPMLGSEDGGGTADKLITAHFFIGGCDWYLTEYDPNDDVAFGYAILNGDLQCAEWGYISIAELRDIKVAGGALEVDFDLHWQIRPASEVDNIVAGGGIW